MELVLWILLVATLLLLFTIKSSADDNPPCSCDASLRPPTPLVPNKLAFSSATSRFILQLFRFKDFKLNCSFLPLPDPVLLLPLPLPLAPPLETPFSAPCWLFIWKSKVWSYLKPFPQAKQTYGCWVICLIRWALRSTCVANVLWQSGQGKRLPLRHIYHNSRIR